MLPMLNLRFSNKGSGPTDNGAADDHADEDGAVIQPAGPAGDSAPSKSAEQGPSTVVPVG